MSLSKDNFVFLLLPWLLCSAVISSYPLLRILHKSLEFTCSYSLSPLIYAAWLCCSRDCPIFYRRKKAQKDMAEARLQLDRWNFWGFSRLFFITQLFSLYLHSKLVGDPCAFHTLLHSISNNSNTNNWNMFVYYFQLSSIY